jgi:hypothetical protein
MVGAMGGVELSITDAVAAFMVRTAAGEPAVVLLALPDDATAAGVATVTVLGPDDGSLSPNDRGGVLVDVGLGRSASYCIRTTSDADLARLQRVAGAAWPDALEVIEDSSGHRVIRTVGRAEVRSAALLPGRLELDRPLPEQSALPSGWVLGASAWLIDADPRTRTRVAAG